MKIKMEQEIWKDVKGYEGKYQVSNMGRVKSFLGDKPSILIPQKQNAGYLYVLLYNNGFPECKLVHRLVCEAFLPNPDNLPQVNHKDENKLNNVLSNLHYCSAAFNCNYGSKPHKMRMAKIRKIIGIKNETEVVVWDSIAECCEALQTYHNKVSEILNNNEKVLKDGIEFIQPSELKEEHFNSDLYFLDINKDRWLLNRVSASYDENGCLEWESPTRRKNKKRLNEINEKTKLTVKEGEKVKVELPKDKDGNIIKADPLPTPFKSE